MPQLKYWNGSAWVDAVVGVQGPQGPQGTQGLQGTQGIQGLEGTQGTQGIQGFGFAQLQGTVGPQGIQGPQGPQGTQGLNGLFAAQGLQGTQGTAAVATVLNTISTAAATTIDTTPLSSFTTVEYTVSIKQGTKIRSCKLFGHTDGTSIVDFMEYGILTTNGAINGVLLDLSASGSNAILQVTIADAAITNATVRFAKVVM